MKIRLKIQKPKEYHCKIHVQQRQTQEPWAFSIYVLPILPIVWLCVCQTPSHTGPVLSKCTKGVFISSARAAQHGVYYTGEIPSLQECVASLEGWKAAQQNTTESTQSEILVKPVNEFTHRRRVLTSSTSREFLLVWIQALEFFLIFTIMKEKCNCVVMLW